MSVHTVCQSVFTRWRRDADVCEVATHATISKVCYQARFVG
ncbi:MAG: hypothetical protein ACLQUY_20410 [Ktedonobacterales bacterium]